VVLVLPCLAVSAWATDTLTLENAGANFVMGGVYTSPYGISINSGSPVSLICDDFTTDISLGESWTAIPTTFDAIADNTNPAGTPKFTPVDIQNYATVAVLAAELMSLPNLASVQAGEISYALWDVFDPTLLNSTSNPYGSITSGQLSAAQGYLAQAEAAVDSVSSLTSLSQISTAGTILNGKSIQGMTIYTPSPKSAAQEFVGVTMDEPPSLSVLAVYFLLGGVLFFVRHRILRTHS
jgi:hypothetical protein